MGAAEVALEAELPAADHRQPAVRRAALHVLEGLLELREVHARQLPRLRGALGLRPAAVGIRRREGGLAAGRAAGEQGGAAAARQEVRAEPPQPRRRRHGAQLWALPRLPLQAAPQFVALPDDRRRSSRAVL